jgi:hypothetical protein
MPLPIIAIANRQRLDVFAGGPNGANRLLIYTGIAVVDSNASVWVIDNRLVNNFAEIVLGSSFITDPAQGDNFNSNPLTFIDGAVSVAPAVMSDQGDSDNLTWAVNSSELDLVDIDPNTKFLKVRVDCSIQGEFTALLRISYAVFISAKDSTPDLLSLVLDDSRVVFGSNHSWVTATVTLSGPAPIGDAAVKLTTDKPTLLALPATVIVPAGASQASLKVYLAVDPGTLVKANITASFGAGQQTVTLDLLP